MLKKRTDSKGIENVLKWLRDQPTLILPAGIPRKIPVEGLWTKSEKILLAYRWLKESGVDVRLFWSLPYPPAAGKPACESMAVEPVLAIETPDKKDVFYYDMEYAPRVGEDSASLWGRTIYGVTSKGGLEERKIPGTSASENRLNLNFNLQLTDDGILTGTVKVTARGGWRHFFFPASPAGADLDFVLRTLLPRGPRCGDVTFKESGRESEISATLMATQAIKGTDGRNILVSVPSLIPDWFENLTSGPFPYTLNFPFLLDSRFSLTLPGSTLNVIFPDPVERNMGKIKYSESYRLKKKTLTAETHVTVGTTEVMGDSAANLSAAIQNWRTFMTRYLPVQLNTK
jgi:hypothetical protein